MSRTPRDSTYMRVVAGGDYDADWDEHQTPPPTTPTFVAAGRRPVWMCKGACARCGDSVWSNEPRVRVGRGYAHVRCPRAFDYYATTAAAAFRAGDDVLRAYATAVGAGSPLQRLDSVQIDAREYTSPEPLQRVARVYSFEAMTSRSL